MWLGNENRYEQPTHKILKLIHWKKYATVTFILDYLYFIDKCKPNSSEECMHSRSAGGYQRVALVNKYFLNKKPDLNMR